MNRKIFITTAVIAGLAALVSVSLPSVTSAAEKSAAAKGPVAPVTKAEGVARSGAWTFEGEADLHDSRALELKIRTTSGPRAFDAVRRLLVGRDVLLVNTRVPIVDLNGRAVTLSRLDEAILQVKGTLLPAGQWRYDLDGEATPTVRVSRIIVVRLDLDS